MNSLKKLKAQLLRDVIVKAWLLLFHLLNGDCSYNPSFNKSCFARVGELTQFVWFIINQMYSITGYLSISAS